MITHKKKLQELLFKRALAFAAFVFATSWLSSTALAADSNPVGTWKSSFTTAQGQTIESTFKLNQDGDKLSGVAIGRNGNEIPLEDVKVVGDQLSFKMIRERNGEKITTKVSAKLSGDELNGKLDSNWGGENRTADWKAKRAKGAVNATGVWKYEIDVETGSTMKLTLDLKQEGDKVTGKVRVGDFEIPITEGKVAGDEISFKIPVETGDTKFTSKYKGTLSGDTIKGKIDSDWGGTDHNYEWNASRAKTASAAGTWKWAVVTKDGESIDLSLKLKQDGGKLTGVVILGDDETAISEGSIKDGQITLKASRVQDGNAQTANFNGKLEGDSIKGKIDSNWSGEQRTYDWNAKRSS